MSLFVLILGVEADAIVTDMTTDRQRGLHPQTVAQAAPVKNWGNEKMSVKNFSLWGVMPENWGECARS
jgi:hypothetical protein